MKIKKLIELLLKEDQEAKQRLLPSQRRRED